MSTITVNMNKAQIAARNTQPTESTVLSLPSMKKILSITQGIQQRLSSRQALLRLTPEQLLDIGISKAQALNESQQPFWK